MSSYVYTALEVLQHVQWIKGTIGLIGNLLVCFTIQKTKALHNVTNYMLLNLAAADTIVSAMSILDSTLSTNFRNRIGERGYCTPSFIYYFNSYFIFHYFQRLFFGHSVLALCLATFERYIGISRPLHYSTFFTKKRLIILLLIVWLTPFVTELYNPIFYITTYAADNCTVPSWRRYPEAIVSTILRPIFIFAIPFIVLALMYIKILINLRRSARHLENQGIRGPSQELHQAHKKVTQCLILVITAFFVLILPSQMLNTVLVVTGMFNKNYRKAKMVEQIIAVLTAMNSAINPVLYVLKYSHFRKACIAMVCPCICWKRSNQVAQELQVISGHK